MYPYQLHSLESLTDLSYLEEVHIENEGVFHYLDITIIYDSDNGDSGIAFHVFGPTRCPHLRRFTASDYQRDVHAVFAAIEDPALARQLAVSCGQMGTGRELSALLRANPAHPSLPLHLRMLDVGLWRDQVNLYGEDGEDVPDDEVPSAEQVLEDLVSDDKGTLEGLAVRLREDSDAEDGFEHLDLLASALVRLVNVTQLVVSRPSGLYWTRMTDEALARAARTLGAASPRLRYVKMYWQHWRI